MSSIQATPTAVLAYCEHHTNAEAAVHFGCNERTIRKWKARAAHCKVPDLAPVLPELHDKVPEFATVAPGDIARDGVYWKCPRCGELMPPLPGTTSAEWNARGCYLHQYTPAAETGNDESTPAQDEPGPELPASGNPPAPTNGNDPAPAPLGIPLRPARPCPRRRITPPFYVWITRGQTFDFPMLQLLAGTVIVWIIVAVGMG